MEYKIEKGVPIPPIQYKRRSGIAAALRKLEPGDSVFFPGLKTRDVGGSLVHSLRERGIKLIRRGLEDGVRVWRVE
jgi:hypothetical protein